MDALVRSRVVVALLAMCLLVVTGCDDGDSQTGGDTSAAGDTAAPDTATTPDGSGTPDLTSTPDVTSAPDATTAPDLTSAMDVTSAPDTVATPDAVSDASNPSDATTSPPDATGLNDVFSQECTITGFGALADFASVTPDGSTFIYEAVSNDADPYDSLALELYGGSSTLTARTITLTGEDYAVCDDCVVLRSNCDANGCSDAFLARQGTVSITEFEAIDGGAFVGTFTDLELIEVTIDPVSFVATPVANGDIWCIANFPFGTTIVERN